jgi:starch phosphorylase
VRVADTVLDANVLTVGFARRFTEYKRPNLLLRDLGRLSRMLLNSGRPIQIIMAGKAHPADLAGKEMIREWINLASDARYRRRIVFIEDYDIDLAQEFVRGVDVWINTPRRPWEACGTSGMKVLVNGGLNCSVLDGWWDEAYKEEAGWAIGDGHGGFAAEVDPRDAESLYEVLENRIIPEFYDRDAAGLPRAWLQRVRKSMSTLTSEFSSTRMIEEYVEKAYLPLARMARARKAERSAKARELNAWSRSLFKRWSTLHMGEPDVHREGDAWHVIVPVFMGEVSPASARVELFADARDELPSEVVILHQEDAIPGSSNGYIYAGVVESSRAADDYTVRVVPFHPDAVLPVELPLIAWQR